MKNRILISILCLMVAVPFMALAEINITEGYGADGIVPISDSGGELISSAVPIDLFPDVNLSGPMAFQLCPKLKHISFPDVIEEIPMGLFSMCNALEEVNIPDGVRRIADNAFMLCTNLKDISLPETLESIGKDAFCYCIVEKNVLPGNLKSLGDGSFVIKDLKTVYCASEIPPFCEIGQYGPFAEEWISEAVLYVPVGTKVRYQSQWPWNLFKEIIETDDFPSSGIDSVVIDGKEDNGDYYDLFGRKVDTLIPGYISNGKKFIHH